MRLEPGEVEYLSDHWPLLSTLRQELRTCRDIRLGVLYGSLARGDEDERSDLDLLVSLPDGGHHGLPTVATRLRGATGRDVDFARLDRIETSPLLLERILDEGRVLVDRDGEWDGLLARRRAIRERARRAHARQMASARGAIANLPGR